MASVNFEKLKSKQQIKAYFAHCDKDLRQETKYHQNEHIDKSLTRNNIQLEGRDYKTTCKMFDDRIALLDATTNTNKRRDRVELVGLDIPCPKDLQDDKRLLPWFEDTIALVSAQFGSDNVMNAYIHYDEVHDYIDARTGEQTTSRVHAHIYVIPEHDGKLNGKWFESRANMRKINNAIQKMSQEKYGVDFMDGSQRKSRDEVEMLKRQSELRQYELQKQEAQAQIDDLQAQIDDLKSQLDDLVDKRFKKPFKSLNGRSTGIDIANVVRDTQERLQKAKEQHLEDRNNRAYEILNVTPEDYVSTEERSDEGLT